MDHCIHGATDDNGCRGTLAVAIADGEIFVDAIPQCSSTPEAEVIRNLQVDLTWSGAIPGKFTCALEANGEVFFLAPDCCLYNDGLSGHGCVEETVEVFDSASEALTAIWECTAEPQAHVVLVHRLHLYPKGLIAREVLRISLDPVLRRIRKIDEKNPEAVGFNVRQWILERQQG